MKMQKSITINQLQRIMQRLMDGAPSVEANGYIYRIDWAANPNHGSWMNSIPSEQRAELYDQFPVSWRALFRVR